MARTPRRRFFQSSLTLADHARRFIRTPYARSGASVWRQPAIAESVDAPAVSRPRTLLALARRAVAARPDALALLMILGLGGTVRLAFFLGAPIFIDGDSFQYYRPAH